MTSAGYPRASRYTDLDLVYSQCSGPGGLELAEFLADRLELSPGMLVLDVGSYRGYQSCFLAREYGVHVVAIDPLDDREDGRPLAEHVLANAASWGVGTSVLPLKLQLKPSPLEGHSVPTTPFVENTFDAVYCTTALEMVRSYWGEAGYQSCLAEIRRVLRPGAVFGLAEPMHHDRPIPEDLLPHVSQKFGWKECFRSLGHAVESVTAAGFVTLESGHAPDAQAWWQAYASHDPFCKLKPDGEPKTLAVDAGRWVSFGYVVARKPE